MCIHIYSSIINIILWLQLQPTCRDQQAWRLGRRLQKKSSRTGFALQNTWENMGYTPQALLTLTRGKFVGTSTADRDHTCLGLAADSGVPLKCPHRTLHLTSTCSGIYLEALRRAMPLLRPMALAGRTEIPQVVGADTSERNCFKAQVAPWHVIHISLSLFYTALNLKLPVLRESLRLEIKNTLLCPTVAEGSHSRNPQLAPIHKFGCSPLILTAP